MLIAMVAGEESRIPLEDALHLKTAELWLEVRQPLRALKELLSVTDEGWHHPWTIQVFQSLGTRMLEPRAR